MGDRHAVTAAGAAAVVLVVALPVAWFAYRVLTATYPTGADAVLSALVRASTWRGVGFTVGQAALSASLALVVGLPGAWILAHLRFPLKGLARAVTLVPFVLPSIIVVICLVSFWGRGGLLGKLGGDGALVYSFGGILLAHVFYNVSLVLRVVGEGWETLDRRLGQTAASLGQGRVGVFFRLTLPLLAPHLAAALFLVFLYSFLSFGVVLVFGGTRWSTLEVLIYRSMYVRLDLAGALSYAAIQLALSLVFLAVGNRWIGRFQTSRAHGHALKLRFRDLGLPARVAVAAYGVMVLVFLVGPLVTMVARAASPEAFRDLLAPVAGGRDVRGILRAEVGQVVAGSVALALVSGTLAFVGALAAALALGRRPAGWRDLALQLPVGLSVVTIAIGVDLLAGDVLGAAAPRVLLVCLLQALMAFPVVFRVLRGAVAGLPATYAHASASLGARWPQTLAHVSLPLLRRGLINGYAYGLAIAFADFTVVMTVGRGDVVTFPVAIYRLIGFRSFDLGLALGLIYLTLVVLLFVAIDATDAEGNRRG